jgi:predicted DNA-binding protein
MSKEVQMSIKMESELRDQFMAAAASAHRPAAQIIRELMRIFINNRETPNELTAQTLRKSSQGEDVFNAFNETDLFEQLGI